MSSRSPGASHCESRRIPRCRMVRVHPSVFTCVERRDAAVFTFAVEEVRKRVIKRSEQVFASPGPAARGWGDAGDAGGADPRRRTTMRPPWYTYLPSSLYGKSTDRSLWSLWSSAVAL